MGPLDSLVTCSRGEGDKKSYTLRTSADAQSLAVVLGCSGPLEESGASWVCLSTVSDVGGPMPDDKLETLLQCCLNMLGNWEVVFGN